MNQSSDNNGGSTIQAPHNSRSAGSGQKAVNELQALYRQAVRYTEPNPEVIAPTVKPPITRMTHNELKAMRVVTAKETETKTPVQVSAINWIIRTFDEFVSSFQPQKEERKRPTCLDSGHQCMHCGQKLSSDQPANAR